MGSLLSAAQRADLYDAENRWAADDEFFLSFTNEHPGSRVLDLGCGTGLLTLAIARAGHQVTGIDPHPGSLAAARTKPGADAVTWIDGTSTALGTDASFDTVLMTSHVAQVIIDDQKWSRTLAEIRRVLVPGGRLVFDSRDPRARIWERWTPAATRNQFTMPDGTNQQLWIDSCPREEGLVKITEHRLFADGARELEDAMLAFRSEQQLRQDLRSAGLHVEAVLGGWNSEPVGQGTGELIVLAHR